MDEESIDSVDESDMFMGQTNKTEKLSNDLITRNVAIFILDKDGKILITKRSSSKQSFPNMYDLSACGNVRSGEDYLQAANREVSEELGITCHLDFVGKIFNVFKENGIRMRYFTGIFICHYDGEIKPNEEIAEMKKMTVDEVEEMMENDHELLTPGFVNDFLYVKDKFKPSQI